MSDATARFFADLTTRGSGSDLGAIVGTVRFDIDDRGRTRCWSVRLDHGDITVWEGAGEADAVLHTDRQVFEQLAVGRMNTLAALLRGAVAMDGDTELLVYATRLFAPAEPTTERRPDVTASGGPS